MSNDPLVLFVDDDQDTREMYAIVLAAAGWATVVARDGAEALARGSLVSPSIVVTDVRMPGPISAVAVCEHFTRLAVPVIAMTGLAPDAPEVRDVERAGCARVLVKPVLADVLTGEILGILRGS